MSGMHSETRRLCPNKRFLAVQGFTRSEPTPRQYGAISAPVDQLQPAVGGSQDGYHQVSMNNPAANVLVEGQNLSESTQHSSPDPNHFNIT